jgi:hypothetical protein
MNSGGTPTKRVSRTLSGSVSISEQVPLSEKEMVNIRKRAGELEGLIDGTQQYIDRMNGTTLEKELTAERERVQKRNEFNAMTKKQLDEYIRINKEASDKYVDIAKEIYSYRFFESEGGKGSSGGKNPHLAKIETEINLLKKSRTEGLITEKEYSRKVEELTLESLRKKLAVKGQEHGALLQLESQIYDAELSLQEQADAAMPEAMKKEHDRELRMLEEKRNKRLEVLQDEETDRNLYSLRAAEIESEYAVERLGIIRSFGEQLEKAEFENGQNRLKAVEENGKETVKAESEMMKARGREQKQFLKTSADFERQYRIKTWQQRFDEEMALLQRYRDKELMDEETFEIAKAAVKKRFDDEQLKARQQYSLNRMKQLYGAEMEALKL